MVLEAMAMAAKVSTRLSTEVLVARTEGKIGDELMRQFLFRPIRSKERYWYLPIEDVRITLAASGP